MSVSSRTNKNWHKGAIPLPPEQMLGREGNLLEITPSHYTQVFFSWTTSYTHTHTERDTHTHLQLFLHLSTGVINPWREFRSFKGRVQK